jgi:DNA-binding CsgD family transcriptional regulator
VRLNLIRPHIIQAYLNAEELAGHRNLEHDLKSAFSENALGMIVLDNAGGVTHATPGAFECLGGYVPVSESIVPRLPQDLIRWALDAGKSAPFVAHQGRDKLIIRRVRQDDRAVLLLAEDNRAAAAAEMADRFQLTQREGEVMRWIAEGKSNSEIASILGLTMGTVKVHVEHILAKLGVENRTAAAMAVRSTV